MAPTLKGCLDVGPSLETLPLSLLLLLYIKQCAKYIGFYLSCLYKQHQWDAATATVGSLNLRAFYSNTGGEITGNWPLTVAPGGHWIWSTLLSSALWWSIITRHAASPLRLQTHRSLLPFCTGTQTHRHPPTHYTRSRADRDTFTSTLLSCCRKATGAKRPEYVKEMKRLCGHTVNF